MTKIHEYRQPKLEPEAVAKKPIKFLYHVDLLALRLDTDSTNPRDWDNIEPLKDPELYNGILVKAWDDASCNNPFFFIANWNDGVVE